ncbi:hypothetical protein E4U41_004289 [Claviceps citrina]|nr:hypothetical protein E4U41_004289 [Claviceps citrina]
MKLIQLKTIEVEKSRPNVTCLGYLAPVPNFDALRASIPNQAARECYIAVHKTVANLGRAMKLNQQRWLIEHLDQRLNNNTLEAIASAAKEDAETCAALSVYFTTLEQAYHWPGSDKVSTPVALHDHKVVIQVLYHPELRHISDKYPTAAGSPGHSDNFSVSAAHSPLKMAKSLLRKAHTAREHGIPLPQKIQDRVNLLYRNCSQDWFIQGDYDDPSSHREFGRLHEGIRPNGTQRSVQQIFQARGLSCLQSFPALLKDLPQSAGLIVSVFEKLQLAVTLAREELFNTVVDEVLWGQTFANFSKPVGLSTIGSGGADCPIFRMLDALCGRADGSSQAALLSELATRSRYFPPGMRSLIAALESAPSFRGYLAGVAVGEELAQSFRAFQQIMWELYEMHRKKAVRIVLSLRAGQLHTSAGARNGSPERHIFNALRAAMNVRFGAESEVRRIGAVATSKPIIKGCDGTVELASIRFNLSTCLVVGAGDALSVTIRPTSGKSETRTYSITSVLSKDNSVAFQTATAVEVCCRKAGHVSSYLCGQEGIFPVEVAIQPKPHFRITGNTSPTQRTVFIAQGGALGIFVSWMAASARLIGQYVLVVGIRSLDMLAYGSQLDELVNDFPANLEVVVCISQSQPKDNEQLLLRHIDMFDGRVTAYLASSNKHLDARRTYVCGSSEFGIDLAKCLASRRERKSLFDESRLSPIITSALPNLRLHVASSNGQSLDRPNLPLICRAELALHNSPGDAWISIGGTVYDISVLPSFHPGGEKVLLYRAGLDAGDMYNAVHAESFEAASLLDQMAIGTLSPTRKHLQRWDTHLETIVQMQNNLMNTSRYEQWPNGDAEQLSRVPPAEVIRSSLAQFILAWTDVARTVAVSEAVVSRLQLAPRGVLQNWRTKMTELYDGDQDFEDVKVCALALRDIFDGYADIVRQFHGIIDGVKEKVCATVEGVELDETVTLEEATLRIVEVLESVS